MLTRPKMQSLKFGRALQRHFDMPLSIIVSPLMEPDYFTPPIPDMDFYAAIFTSQTAVEAAKRISANGTVLPRRAFCVGSQTAKAARLAGFEAISADSDALGLVEMMKSANPKAALLHLRGEISHGDVANLLNSAGIETYEAVVYRQAARPLNVDARAFLQGTDPAFVPLFSPRTARIFSDEVKATGGIAPLRIAAISPAVAKEVVSLHPEVIETAASPDAKAMIAALEALFATDGSP